VISTNNSFDSRGINDQFYPGSTVSSYMPLHTCKLSYHISSQTQRYNFFCHFTDEIQTSKPPQAPTGDKPLEVQVGQFWPEGVLHESLPLQPLPDIPDSVWAGSSQSLGANM